MDPIVYTPVVTPVQRASRHFFALDSFDAWLDAEPGNLADLFDITDHSDAIDDIEVLGSLHLAPGASPEDVRRLDAGTQYMVWARNHLGREVRN